MELYSTLHMQQRAVLPETVGTVRMSGEPGFDCDSVKDDAEAQIRWLGHPFSRLVLNPNTHCTAQAYLPMRDDLALSVGYYAGGADVMPFGRDDVCRSEVVDGDGVPRRADIVDTVWSPYRIAYSANYSGLGLQLTGSDFFAGPNALLRIVRCVAGGEADFRLGGAAEGSLSWEDGRRLLVMDREIYCEAVMAIPLDAEGKRTGDAAELAVEGAAWQANIAAAGFAFAYGFATKEEGAAAAADRARQALADEPALMLAAAKSAWDRLLGSVPAPQRWGIRAVDSQGVSPSRHRSRYYAAWAFILTNTLPETPERGFPYRQVTVGKPSLWYDGSVLCPGNCAWESFYEIQLLALIDPETAWSATEGFMSMIDEDGWLEGECLPSQKARTAWIVHAIAPNAERLRAMYPAIRRYLLWREANPYWLWSPGGPKKPEEPLDQKDISFVSQWMTDVDCAAAICRELGEPAEADMWMERKNAMIEMMRDWFFTPEGVFGIYWANSGKREDNDLFTIDMLVNRLPADLDAQMVDYYLNIHDPGKELAGLKWSKYANAVNAIYGLYDRGMDKQADELADALLRHTLRVRDFYEVERPGSFIVEGVNPSAFAACQVIGLTWLRNGVRFDRGKPEPLRAADGTTAR